MSNHVSNIPAPVMLIYKDKMHDLYDELYERFPAVDKKIAREAFDTLLTKAYNNEYTCMLTDAVLDKLFMEEVDKLLSAQV